MLVYLLSKVPNTGGTNMITEQKIVDRMDAYRDRLSALIERLKKYPEIIRVGGNTYKFSCGDTYVSVDENGILFVHISSILDEFADARACDVDSLIAFKDAIEKNEKSIKSIHNILDEYDIDKSRILAELDAFFD